MGAPPLKVGSFGPLHVIEPRSEHTHTAILLHGRGSNGPEFAEELSETASPGQKPLTQRFPGWRWSVAYVQSVMDHEIARLGGATERLVIVGISQGGAIGMWTLLCQRDLGRRLGTFVGVSTWLPFAANIAVHLGRGEGLERESAGILDA
ncbi:Acyl-protein thioesterase 1 [Madurella mycetomatis]|uniref:Acyl-protein thioesterase 1 n=1 Tax=Madurella mycetomatis TaxID=100816 RepID=A0A175W098_9PEZI|nr:Acyl-protein thioesterase 1 [Madurella mycetomatis]